MSPAGTALGLQTPALRLAFSAGTWNHGPERRIAMATISEIDWSQCSLVEINPKVHSGSLVLRGTRMPVSAILDNFDYGVSVAEIAQQFELTKDRVEEILTYAKSHRVAHPV
jgi:uncharacterized protein (DUF433 family)